MLMKMTANGFAVVDKFVSILINKFTQSNNFPYCDGTHKSYNKIHGTDFKPLEVTKEENGKPQDKYICGCGLSKKRFVSKNTSKYSSPFCDGSHKKIVFHSSLPYVVTVFALGYIWGTKLLAKQ